MICKCCDQKHCINNNKVCNTCLSRAKYDSTCDDMTVLGILIDGNFYCEFCGAWFETPSFEEKTCKVYKVNVGIYSQTCSCCNDVIYHGGVGTILFEAKKPKRAYAG